MNYSQITDFLFIGTTPGCEDYDVLRHLGVELVINMRAERRPYPDPNIPPIAVIWLPSFDMPLIPIPLRFLMNGMLAARTTIENGGKVYAHCAKGVHRGVAMGAAILIGLGLSTEESLELIKRRRQVADPDAWYIRRRIERFADNFLGSSISQSGISSFGASQATRGEALPPGTSSIVNDALPPGISLPQI